MPWPDDYRVLRFKVRGGDAMTRELNAALDLWNRDTESRDHWSVWNFAVTADGHIVYLLHRYLFADDGEPQKKGRTPDATSDQRRRSGRHARGQRSAARGR